MYLLSEYSYDYYEWEEPVCVSKEPGLLIKRMELSDLPIVTSTAKHEELARSGTPHYRICRISELR